MPTKRRMRLLIANHRWWYPTVVNGADIANHEFARRLQRHGVDVRVFGMVAPNMGATTRQRRYVTDGVKVTLVQSDFIKRLSKEIKEFGPDLVMTSCPETSCGKDDIRRMMNTISKYGLPVLLYIHDLMPVMELFEGVKDRLAAIATNSQYMANQIRSIWNREAQVIYPVPSRSTFKVSQTGGPFITFFNPLPHKGLELVRELVKGRFHDRSFLFVEGFMEPGAHGIALVRSGNVVHARRSPDVASVYMMTHTLIVPSQWAEPFGRVTLEAMYNQVPVIASNTGGLTESVGKGGILIDDFTNPDAFGDAVLALDDSAYRANVVEKGNRHVEQFSMERQVEQFRRLFHKLVAQKK